METLAINHPDTETGINRGRFFTMFAPDASLLGELKLIVPEIATGAVTVQVCSVPTL